MKSLKFGFYSAKAVEQGCDTAIYQTPTGKEVEVTAMCLDMKGSSYGWPDKIFLGVITRFLRVGKEDKYSKSKYEQFKRVREQEFNSNHNMWFT